MHNRVGTKAPVSLPGQGAVPTLATQARREHDPEKLADFSDEIRRQNQ
jgi:hypothetical protein